MIKPINKELNAVLAIFTLISGDMFYQIWYDIIVNLLTNVFHAEKRYISMFYVEQAHLIVYCCSCCYFCNPIYDTQKLPQKNSKTIERPLQLVVYCVSLANPKFALLHGIYIRTVSSQRLLSTLLKYHMVASRSTSLLVTCLEY